MKHTETVFRAIKDRIAAAMGEMEEAGPAAEKKENHRRLSNAATELHKCADDMQNVLMRIRPR
ncbi:MAG: hypothetical protein ACYC64_08645 [Armatimonadota bacterium]